MFKVFAFGFGARTRTINDLISDALPGTEQRDVASCHLLRASTHVQQQRRATVSDAVSIELMRAMAFTSRHV